ncbi:ankyrin repeat protein [Paramecium bursaria Chlorella virus NE-JV-1]|nr:ankyrin repeat protein [Paramecium bursaria Chlorella virus NE-JV-1]
MTNPTKRLADICKRYVPKRLKLFRTLIKNGADVNYNNDSCRKQSILLRVCDEYSPDKLELVRLLVASGADVNYEYNSYPTESILLRVCDEYSPDKLELVRLLVASGADVNYKCDHYPKESILLRVCDHYSSDKLELVRLLVASGADVNYEYNSYPTESILTRVIKKFSPDKLELVRCLIENGAQIHGRKTFEHVVRKFSFEKKELLELLMDNDFTDISRHLTVDLWENPTERYALLDALQVIFFKRPQMCSVPSLIHDLMYLRDDEPIYSWQKLVIKRLHSLSHIFEYEDDEAFQHIFCNVELTRFIFRMIDISTLSFHHSRNFYNAIKSSLGDLSSGVVSLFIHMGVDLNIVAPIGRTLLHYAAVRFDPDVLDALCYNVRDINAIDILGKTAWDRVKLNGFIQNESETDSETDDDIESCESLFTRYSRVFIKHCADPFIAYTNDDEKNEDLFVSKLAAIYTEDMIDIVEYVYKNVDINRTLYDGNTIVHEAARYDNHDLLKYALRVGARTDSKNGRGNLPIHIATYERSTRCMKLLMNAQDICVQSDDGVTFSDIVDSRDVYDVMSDAYSSDSSMTVVKQCVAALPHSERKRVRSILMTLNRTSIPKTLFAYIVSNSF